jgi:hypothetical protein
LVTSHTTKATGALTSPLVVFTSHVMWYLMNLCFPFLLFTPTSVHGCMLRSLFCLHRSLNRRRMGLVLWIMVVCLSLLTLLCSCVMNRPQRRSRWLWIIRCYPLAIPTSSHMWLMIFPQIRGPQWILVHESMLIQLMYLRQHQPRLHLPILHWICFLKHMRLRCLF